MTVTSPPSGSSRRRAAECATTASPRVTAAQRRSASAVRGGVNGRYSDGRTAAMINLSPPTAVDPVPMVVLAETPGIARSRRSAAASSERSLTTRTSAEAASTDRLGRACARGDCVHAEGTSVVPGLLAPAGPAFPACPAIHSRGLAFPLRPSAVIGKGPPAHPETTTAARSARATPHVGAACRKSRPPSASLHVAETGLWAMDK